MKRIISALLILIIMIPPMVLPAHAATLVQADAVVRLTTDVGENGAAVGDTVTVTVEYENIPACGAVDFNLVYDTEYLQAPAKSDVTMNIAGMVRDKNPAYIIEEKTSQEFAGRQAVKVVSANNGDCLKGTDGKGTLFTVKFVVAKEAPAPGIPLEFFGTFSDLYSNRDLCNTIQVFNTHIATANPTKEVTAVSLKQAPTKTDYVQGQALNMEGGRLNVTYSDNSTQEVHLSLAQVTQYDFTKLGTQTVKAVYAEKEVSFEIQTEESVLSSISIGQVPSTVEYIQGKTASLDLSDGVLLLHYTGGIVKTLDMSDALVTLSGYDKDQLGVQKIKVQYGGFETEYKIAVVKKALSDIDVRTPMVCDACGDEWSAFDLIPEADDPLSMDFNERLAYIANTANNVTCPSETCAGATFSTKMKMVYFVGEDFDVKNAKLFITYSGGTTEEIDMTLDMVEFKNSFPTTQNVTVAYGAQWMLIKNVQTRKKEATAITVTQKPKTEYVKGQSFDGTGGIIHIKYNDGSEEDLPMDHEDVRVQYSGMDELGVHRVTVFYESQQAYFDIKVIARVVEKIAVDEEAKSTYIQGQELDPETKLLVTYNDKITETVYLRNATVEGYNSEQIGLQVPKITYGGVTYDWPVTVEEKVVTKLEVVGTLPTTILEGVDLSLEDCTLTATYNEGKLVEENIAIAPEMIKNFDKSQHGAQTVTIEFEEGKVSFEITVLEKSLTSIEVEGVKDQYLFGDALDRSVGQIKLNYDNGSEEYVDFSDENVSVDGFRSDVAGEQLITVEYQGVTDTYLVTVYIEILSISVTPPKKTVYKEGEPLDLADGVLHITQPNGTIDVPLSEGMVLGYEADRIGEQTLTVAVGDHTAEFKVTVVAKQLTGITVSPETIEHKEWEELDLSQVVVTAWYDNNTSETVTENASKTEYDTYVLYTYEGKTATLNLNVIQRAPTFIEWAEEPLKRAYFVGDPLLKDGTIRVHYNDQTNEQIYVTDENVSVIGNTNEAGSRTVYVKYKDLSPISFEITVVPVTVEKIKITEKPNCSYIEGQPLNVAGGMILVTYNNEDTEPLAMDAAGVSVSGYNPEKIGEQTITVTYGEKSDSFTVNVRAKKAVSIKVSTRPKTDYLEGKDTALNLAGGKITVFYDNNTTAEVSLTDPLVKVSGFDKTVFGKQTITVSYPGVSSVTFYVTMKKKEVSSIVLAAMPTKTLYRQGVEKFDTAGGKLTVYYNNDTKETLELSAANITGFSNLFAGDVTVTAAYEGYAVEFKVMILAENPFKDVKVNEYYETPVLWAVTKKITTGVNETDFAPDNECTRAQIVTFLWRTAGEPEPKTTKNPFKDVKKGEYYYDAVLWAVENGITTGIDATHFAPDAACTRGQSVTFIWRANGKPSVSAMNAFKDVKKGEYYYEAVLWAVEKNITNGVNKAEFKPDMTCTRAHIVTFLYRADK